MPPDLYNGKNSHVIHGAAMKGVEKLFDHASRKNFNIMLDGTFANRGVVVKNIERMLKKSNRNIFIFIYQDAVRAWGFTKKREKIEKKEGAEKRFYKRLFLNLNIMSILSRKNTLK